jgi:hypothetical protein
MVNMGWKHHNRLLYLYFILFVQDIFLILACDIEFCNNLKIVYFGRGQNVIPFSKSCLNISHSSAFLNKALSAYFHH